MEVKAREVQTGSKEELFCSEDGQWNRLPKEVL